MLTSRRITLLSLFSLFVFVSFSAVLSTVHIVQIEYPIWISIFKIFTLNIEHMDGMCASLIIFFVFFLFLLLFCFVVNLNRIRHFYSIPPSPITNKRFSIPIFICLSLRPFLSLFLSYYFFFPFSFSSIPCVKFNNIVLWVHGDLNA